MQPRVEAVRDLHRVCVAFLVDGEFYRLASPDPGDCLAVLVASSNRGDVAQVDGPPGDVGDDRVTELRNRTELVERANEEALVALFEPSAGQVDVLCPYALGDLFDADAELRQLLLVDGDLDLVFQAATNLDRGRAFLGFEVGLQAILGQAAQRLKACLVAVRRRFRLAVQQPQAHYRFRRGIETQQ